MCVVILKSGAKVKLFLKTKKNLQLFWGNATEKALIYDYKTIIFNTISILNKLFSFL